MVKIPIFWGGKKHPPFAASDHIFLSPAQTGDPQKICCPKLRKRVCVPNNPTWFSPGSKWSITPEKTPGTIGLSLLSLPMSRAKTHVTENQCRLPAQAPTHICYPCNRTDSSPRRQPLEGLQLAMSHNPGT